ncbi:hypothetical protein K2173_002501 [Erythroxylum novogranatense]|uniref:RING-type E3 ubiquitin transferase n=1 Tax=Erythroxylum novogranatense TaxID=1862640 RepID=A0AAV8TQP6_9ROSI|nr:hypothetical protein K2173_002501 [Erythroxylum novogranatense]
MEISVLKVLVNNITSFLQLSSLDNINLNPVQKPYWKAEEILKLLRPILAAIIDSEIASDELLSKAFLELGQCVDELRDLFENWQPLSSQVYFILQIESLLSKVRTLGLDIFSLLKASHEHLPDELSSSSVEFCIQKIKHMGYEQTASTLKEAIKVQADGVRHSSEILLKIGESLNLKSNQEILIEAVALEKLKEKSEQAEKIREAELIEQMIAIVTSMHDHLVLTKQSETTSPVPIPNDFCCPLSLELMTDPVIVASGQTYERAFIKNWIELGLNVCPKTRQTLAHTNLIPNYTVKALIANWCELNNVKLPDPAKSLNFSQSSPLPVHAESGAAQDPHALSQFRSKQPMPPESTHPPVSPGKNKMLPSGINREGTSPRHPRSISEGSLSSVVGNGQASDIARLSVLNSDERPANLEEWNKGSDDDPSVSLTKKQVPSSFGQEEPVHIRSASALPSNMNSQGTARDASESSDVSNHLCSYSSDTSGEVKPESRSSTPLSIPQREPFSPRLFETRSRSQTLWRRPSDRLVQRIVSSPTIETRTDLSGIETQVKNLVDVLKSPSIDTQREATAEIRMLAKHNMDNRIVIANCGVTNLLVDLLRSSDTKIQENAVTALLNLSINDNNKAVIASAGAIEPLIDVLKTGSPEAKENSAATLFSLSVIEENKIRIGKSGAIGPLVDLLGNGTPRGKKDAATALFNLSIFHENKARIVQAGAVRHLVELMDPTAGLVDKAVAVLANLATIPEGRSAIGQEGGIPFLVEVVELGSARGKENAAAALLQLCTTSNRFCNMVLQEGAVPPLVALSQSGTPRAKEKAQGLLSYFRNQRHGNAGRG